MDSSERRRHQAIGMIVGFLGGALTALLWPPLQSAVGWGGMLLWGAAIGAALGSLAQFEAAGRAITRSDNRLFNLAVGLCIPLAIIGLLALGLRLLRG